MIHVLWSILHDKCDYVGQAAFGASLDHVLVKVRSRSGQGQVKLGQISKLIFLHKMGIESMQLVTGSSMVVFVLPYVV